MKLRILSAALVAAFLTLTATLHAQVPQIISYQGRVAVGTVNFNGSGSFKFALVDAAGTTTFWSNDGTSTAGSQPAAAVALTVTKGLYSVLLGDTTIANMTAIPNSVFANPDVRLRVWFNDGTNGSQLLSPDQRIAAVGYAIMAGTAATVPDGAITAAKIAPGAVGTAQLANNLQFNGGITLQTGGITLPVPAGSLAITADNAGISLDGIHFSAANGMVLSGETGDLALSASDSSATLDATGLDFTINSNSAVKFATSGSGVLVDGKQVMTAGEKLHMVRGKVNANGTVAEGTGFTVTLAPTGSGGSAVATVYVYPATNSATAYGDITAQLVTGKSYTLESGFAKLLGSSFGDIDDPFDPGNNVPGTTMNFSPNPAGGVAGSRNMRRDANFYPTYTVTFAPNTFTSPPVLTFGGMGGLPSSPGGDPWTHWEVYLDNSHPPSPNSFTVIVSPGVNSYATPPHEFEFIAVGSRQ